MRRYLFEDRSEYSVNLCSLEIVWIMKCVSYVSDVN